MNKPDPDNVPLRAGSSPTHHDARRTLWRGLLSRFDRKPGKGRVPPARDAECEASLAPSPTDDIIYVYSVTARVTGFALPVDGGFLAQMSTIFHRRHRDIADRFGRRWVDGGKHAGALADPQKSTTLEPWRPLFTETSLNLRIRSRSGFRFRAG
jgi:hypothetical protein